MRTNKKIRITLCFLLLSWAGLSAMQDEGEADGPRNLQMNCISEHLGLAEELAAAYQLEYPNVQIQLTTIKGSSIYGQQIPSGVSLVDKACLSSLDHGVGKTIVLGRDVIVPVMNKSLVNEKIFSKGISQEQFLRIYSEGGDLSWGELMGMEDNRTVEAYLPGDQCFSSYLADYLGVKPGALLALEPAGPEILPSVLKDHPSAIGFCSLACLADLEQKGEHPGIGLVPIDRDGDGVLGHFEEIYGSYAQLAHGIYVGKYPRELYSKVYALGSENLTNETEKAFLEWMITRGQNIIVSAGILGIDYGERASGLKDLYPAGKLIADVPVKASAGYLPVLISGLLFLALLSYRIIRKPVKTRNEGKHAESSRAGLFGEQADLYPAGLIYDRSHTWLFMEKTGNVRIGIDDFIQRVCGSLTRVRMKSPGEFVQKGESLFTIIQHGKMLEIKSPISGILLEQNETLKKDVSTLNSDPFGEGWICLIEPQNWISETKTLFMGDDYGAWLKEEFLRLKGFFTGLFRDDTSLKELPVLQDGGDLIYGPLEDCGPDVWEEFQTTFIKG